MYVCRPLWKRSGDQPEVISLTHYRQIIIQRYHVQYTVSCSCTTRPKNLRPTFCIYTTELVHIIYTPFLSLARNDTSPETIRSFGFLAPFLSLYCKVLVIWITCTMLCIVVGNYQMSEIHQ